MVFDVRKLVVRCVWLEDLAVVDNTMTYLMCENL